MGHKTKQKDMTLAKRLTGRKKGWEGDKKKYGVLLSGVIDYEEQVRQGIPSLEFFVRKFWDMPPNYISYEHCSWLLART